MTHWAGSPEGISDGYSVSTNYFKIVNTRISLARLELSSNASICALI
jgi:hypothetical protein